MVSAPSPRHRSSQHTTASRPPVHSPPQSSPWVSLFRYDLPASLVVLLTAIPLSLGIAAASGAPLMAGLIAAVVGGIVAGVFGGAPLLISGAATGLTVIVAGLVHQYGFAATAGITVAAGVLQLILGATKVGRAALSLSPAVVYGLLAGIGVVIALSQIHVVLGGQPQTSVWQNLIDLPAQLAAHHDEAFGIGMLTIAILIAWPRLPKVSLIPAPLVAVAIATAVGVIFSLDVPRVNLPDNPLAGFTLPAIPQGSFGEIVVAICMVATVASVESLLSAVAIDKLHRGKRANLNRELIAQGVANVASGALGGLPIAGGIMRSTTNIAAGARTRGATILHGIWVAVFVAVLANVLELIPLASLAAILVVIGVQLVSWNHIRELWRHREFPVYATTFAGVVLLDLVKGVLLGIVVALGLALYRLTHATIEVDASSDHIRDKNGHNWLVTIRGSLIFLGVARLTNQLRQIPYGQRVSLTLQIDFMDHAAYEAIHDWCLSYERLGGTVTVHEITQAWYHQARSGRPEQRKSLPGPLPRWFAPWSFWQSQQEISPAAGSIPHPRDGSVDPMMVGMHEFEQNYAPLVRPFLADLAANGQKPQQLFVTCADSRVVPNLITTSGPGDLFTLRNIGNLVPRYQDAPADASVGAAIEFAVDHLGVSSIVVCGHSDCGAMKAGLTNAARQGSQLAEWLQHINPSLTRYHATSSPTMDGVALPPAEQLSIINVIQQLDNLMTFPTVREAVENHRVSLVGMYFDIASARVFLVDHSTGKLAPVASNVNA